MKTFFILIVTCVFVITSCRKEQDPPGEFFKCKINGAAFIPDNCANCLSAYTQGGTLLILTAGAGGSIVRVSVQDAIIKAATYTLNNNPITHGFYDNNFTPNDDYKTNDTYTGKLNITRLDKGTKDIEGTFTYTAYNAIQNKRVTISDGQFRLKYPAY